MSVKECTNPKCVECVIGFINIDIDLADEGKWVVGRFPVRLPIRWELQEAK